MRCVYRTSIPVDDRVHELVLTGPILHVATRWVDVVEVWHLHDDVLPERVELVRVAGTGHALPDDVGGHLGTAVGAGGQLVWHLFGCAPPVD